MGRPRTKEPRQAKSGKLYSGGGNRQLIPAEKQKHAPPVPYSPEVMDLILDQIAVGQTIKAITKRPGMPDDTTVYRWLAREDVEEKYTKAVRARARVRAEMAEQVCDDLNVETERDQAQIQELRIRNNLRLAALGDPQRYSDKLQVNHSGNVNVAVSLRLNLGTPQHTIDATSTEVTEE